MSIKLKDLKFLLDFKILKSISNFLDFPNDIEKFKIQNKEMK